MPYEVESPLSAAVAAAGSALAGRQAKQQQDVVNRQEDERLRQSAAVSAAQAENYRSLGSERAARTANLQAVLPYLPAEKQAQVAALLGKGDLEGAQALLATAEVGKTNAQTTDIGAHTALQKAETKEILQGKLPLDQARTAYEKWRPAYDRGRLQEATAALSERAQAAAASLAGRIHIAGMSTDARYAVAAMTAARMDAGEQEKEAFQTSLAEYNNQFKVYAEDQKLREEAAAKGKTVPGQPMQMPEFKFDINSTGGGGGGDQLLPLFAAIMATLQGKKPPAAPHPHAAPHVQPKPAAAPPAVPPQPENPLQKLLQMFHIGGGGGPTPVETRMVNGKKWTKYSDGTFKETP